MLKSSIPSAVTNFACACKCLCLKLSCVDVSFVFVLSIGVGDEGGGPGGHLPPPTPLEINSSKCEIIRAPNFGEDLFIDHPSPMRKMGEIFVHLEIFWIVHLGRFIVSP